MDVKMCDRCKRVYIPNEKVIDSNGEIIEGNFNKIAIFKDNVTVNYKSFDICPYCAKDFLNWINNWMKGDEN